MHYDFDTIVERRGTDSIKWSFYEPDVLPMWVADMDFASPQPVIDALQERIQHGVFGYASFDCDLYAAIQERLERLYGWQVKDEEILLFPGVMNAVHLAAVAYSGPGEGILLQTPVYPYIYKTPHTTYRTLQTHQLDRQADGTYTIDFERFEAAITPETRVFILCNPHNPVGRVLRREELERLAEICLRHNLTIISDEIHCDLLFDGHHHTPMAALGPEIAARTLTTMAPSKTFNLAGLQCSFAVIQDAEMRRRLRAARQGLTGGANLLGQVAARAAYQHGDEWLAQLLAYLEANRDFLYDYANTRLPGVRMGRPEGTYLAWLDCRESGIEGNPTDFFLEQARVGLSDGATFGAGGEGFVRLNFGCPRALLVEGLERMRRALTER